MAYNLQNDSVDYPDIEEVLERSRGEWLGRQDVHDIFTLHENPTVSLDPVNEIEEGLYMYNKWSVLDTHEWEPFDDGRIIHTKTTSEEHQPMRYTIVRLVLDPIDEGIRSTYERRVYTPRAEFEECVLAHYRFLNIANDEDSEDDSGVDTEDSEDPPGDDSSDDSGDDGGGNDGGNLEEEDNGEDDSDVDAYVGEDADDPADSDHEDAPPSPLCNGHVIMKAKRIEEHRRKYQRLRKEKELLDLHPLPVTALRNCNYERLYQDFEARMQAMTKPTYTTIVQHAKNKKLAIVFVPTCKHVHLTAVDLMVYSHMDNSQSPDFLLRKLEVLEPFVSQICKETLCHGVGFLHEGLSSLDQDFVTQLFEAGRIQVCLMSSSLCWGTPLTAHLVVVIGTQYYDGRENSHSDYLFSDLLQMIGRASRSLLDNAGKCVIFCHTPGKKYYKKFLYEAFPMESHLQHFLHDNFNAEVVAGVIENKQDTVDYLTWTFMYRRLPQNPNHYSLQGVSHRHMSDHLSQLVENTLSDREAIKCIEIEDEMELSPLNLAPNRGMNWSFSNKVSAASSQFLSFRPSQEDRHRKSGNYQLLHSGSFVPSSVADVYDSNRKAPYSSVQGVRMFPNSNQQEETNAVSMAMPGFQSHHYAPGGRSFISNSNNSQPLVGVPIMAPPISILPAPGSIVGTTDIRSSSKPIGSPAQLTIFYAGSVCVYDDISPEKAKAIMLLSGNGSSMPQAYSLPQTHQHASSEMAKRSTKLLELIKVRLSRRLHSTLRLINGFSPLIALLWLVLYLRNANCCPII